MQVTIYHTTNCAFCKVEMEWLDSKNIKYEHKNIEEDDKAREYIQNLSGVMSVPITVINVGGVDHLVYGFDRKKLAYLLQIPLDK